MREGPYRIGLKDVDLDTSLWSTTPNVKNDPNLVAAQRLAERGFRITFQKATARDGTELPDSIAIHCATLADRQALNKVISSPDLAEIRKLETYGKPLPAREEIQTLVDQVIERGGVKPVVRKTLP